MASTVYDNINDVVLPVCLDWNINSLRNEIELERRWDYF